MGVYQRKLKSGIKWRYIGYHYSSPSVYSTYEEARQAELKFLNSKQDSSLQSLVDAYEIHLRTRSIRRDHQKAVSRYLGYFVASIGPQEPIETISITRINSFLDSYCMCQVRKGFSTATANRLLVHLKSFFKYLVDHRGLTHLTIPNLQKFPESAPSRYVPSYGEIVLVRAELEHSSDQLLLFDTALETGSRIGDLLNLTVQDIGERLITLTTHKSRNSALREWQIPRPNVLTNNRIPQQGRVFSRWTPGSSPIFLQRAVQKVQNRENNMFPDARPWRWHSVRAYCAVTWFNSGMRLAEISKRLGHLQGLTTEKYLVSLRCNPYQFSDFSSAAIDPTSYQKGT